MELNKGQGCELKASILQALCAANVDYIVAPYEADAQLAYLERRGTIQGIITEDSDLIVFGCKTVLYKMNDEGRCIELLHQNRSRCKNLQFSLFTDAHFRQMAILSGCDYLTSIPGEQS
jgi:exonuclease-1